MTMVAHGANLGRYQDHWARADAALEASSKNQLQRSGEANSSGLAESGSGIEAHRGASASERMTALLALLASGDDEDLAFIVFAERIMSLDQQIKTKIKALQQKQEIRKAYAERLEKVKTMLETAKRDAATLDDDENIALWEVARRALDPETEAEKFWSDKTKLAHAEKWLKDNGFDLRKADFQVNPVTGVVDSVTSGTMAIANKNDVVNTTNLQTEADRLENIIKDLDSTNEIESISLNSLINKKGQASQLLSNILKKQDDVRSAIIGNMR
jgi:hypothetical protein